MKKLKCFAAGSPQATIVACVMYYPCVTHLPCVAFPSYSRHALIGAVSLWLFRSPGLNLVLSFLSSFLPVIAQKSSKYNCIRQRRKKIKLYKTRATFPGPVWLLLASQGHGRFPLCLSHTFSCSAEDSLFVSSEANDVGCRRMGQRSGFHYGGRAAVELPAACRDSCVKSVDLFIFESAAGALPRFDSLRALSEQRDGFIDAVDQTATASNNFVNSSRSVQRCFSIHAEMDLRTLIGGSSVVLSRHCHCGVTTPQ